MIMLYPYGYTCVNNKICADIHMLIKTQINTRSIEVILFMHDHITQMHEQLFIRLMIDLYGWDSGFVALVGACILSIVFLLLTLGDKGHQ